MPYLVDCNWCLWSNKGSCSRHVLFTTCRH